MSSTEAAKPGRFAPWKWAGIVGLLVAAGLLAAVFLDRGPIARRLAQDWLARHHVPADLTIRDLSLTGLSAGVRIGDPAHPAFTAERMDVGYAIVWPWQAGGFGVRTQSVRLVRPRLALALTPAGVDLGPLKPLLDWVKSLPPGPMPDIDIDDGAARLAGAAGEIGLSGSASLRGGALAHADGRLTPFRLALTDMTVVGVGGALTAAGDAGRLELGPLSLAASGAQIRAQGVTLDARLPVPPANGPLAGPVVVTAQVDGVSARAGALAASGAALTARLDGDLGGAADRPRFHGKVSLSGKAGRFEAGAGASGDLAADLALADVSLTEERAGLKASGAGRLDLTAHVKAPQGAGEVAARRLALSGYVVAPKAGRPAMKINLAGGVTGSGAAAAATIRQSSAGLAAAPALRDAVARAIAAFAFAAPAVKLEAGDANPRLTIAGPVALAARSGARLTLTPGTGGLEVGPAGARGALRLALAGGGLPTVMATADHLAASPDRFSAHIHAQGVADVREARQAKFDLTGDIIGGARSLQLTLAGCAPLSAASLGAGANAASGVAVRLCPDQGPVIAVTPAGWTAQVRFEDAGGVAAETAVQGASGRLSARQAGRAALAADVVLSQARVSDHANPVRFAPVALAGRAEVRGEALTGLFTATAAGGRPLATITLRQSLDTGAGEGTVDTPDLAFAPGKLQPVDLSPLAAGISGARGAVRFQGRFAWGGAGAPSSRGELTLHDFTISTPLGPASGIDTRIALTGLTPPTSADNQALRIGKIDAVTPLTGIEVRFRLDQNSLAIRSATAGFARGQVSLQPMDLPLASGGAIHGVLDLERIDLGEVLAATSLDQQIKLDAVVSGALPFEVAADNLAIRGGHLAAVQPGRLTISRQALGAPASQAKPADPKAAQAQIAQNLAYQAMEDLAFDQLDAKLDTRPDDRLGIVFHIRGRHAPPKEARASIRVGDLLRGQALARPLPLPSGTQINLTLDTSLNFAELIRQLKADWSQATAAADSSKVQQDRRSLPAH